MFNTGFSNPESIIEQLSLGEAATVVDLGAGTGHYAIAAAKAVGGNGHVYAVDVQKDILGKIHDQASMLGITNIKTQWGDIEQLNGSKVADSAADAVLVCNTLFQIEDKSGLVQEVLRIIRPKGRLLVVDWTDSHAGMGPDPSLIVSANDAEQLFTQAGFTKERDVEAGDHHYGFIMRAP